MRIGVVGTGRMGTGMALSLLRAGHEVLAYNRTAEKARLVVEAGAKMARTPGECASCGTVLSVLANDEAVRAVVEGKEGILRHLPTDGIHVSSSTISVALVREMAEASGGRLVSAPVLGRPDVAEKGQLAVLSAGPSAAVERVRWVLDAVGRRTFFLGEQPEQAAAAKVAANYLIAITLESLGEAFGLVERNGLDAEAFLQLLTETLFDSPLVRNYGPMVAGRRFGPGGFSLALGLKDANLALAAAGDVARMPLGLTLRAQFEQAIAQGLGEADWAAVSEVARGQ